MKATPQTQKSRLKSISSRMKPLNNLPANRMSKSTKKIELDDFYYDEMDEAVLNLNAKKQLTQLLEAVKTVQRGDFSVRLPKSQGGLIGEVGEVFNSIVELNESMTKEFMRVRNIVGKEGKMTERIAMDGVKGSWQENVNSVNSLIGDLVQPTTEVARVITSVAKGDLSQKMSLEIDGRFVKGEFFRIGTTVNAMVDQLNSFAAEVTRVAKEVGTEGKLGGQAEVKGVAGTWKDLTDNVNGLARNLTDQVRNIAKVTTAVAKGDLSQKITVDARGEVYELKNTINVMVDQLNSFAAEVTRVAKEVGTEGKLGGQAEVKGVSGTWKDLTDNVNGLARNLTDQVRAIAEVSTAVTKGDLTRSISVEAQGEVAALKNNINQMIENLKDTTEKNTKQDWLKTNLAKFSGMMQGQRSITAVAQLIMSELTPLVDGLHGTFFVLEYDEKGEPALNMSASYAFNERKNVSNKYKFKEGIVGQCAFEKKRILITEPPEDYVRITSSLGESTPVNIIVLPVLFEGDLKAVIELASFKPFSQHYITFLDQLMDSVGVIMNMISSSMRTEELLKELKKSNAELEAQAKELEDKAKLLEVKNQEVELASRSLEEKAEQLSLISKYKSEFLANMSHELRTPLNSLLILSKMLAENKNSNLTAEQVKFATTMHSAGQDLLDLINEILDLSKVEAGKMPINPKTVKINDIQEYIEQTFGPVASYKGLEFNVVLDSKLPESMFTDENRLYQILKNLLSNAFKFTEKGSVDMKISVAPKDQKYLIPALNMAQVVIAFAVKDTGIGIPEEKQKLIFEAFQQADGTTSRKYGGTGLGLTISREIARLLGGSIDVNSISGVGSTFTLYLPQKCLEVYVDEASLQPPVLISDQVGDLKDVNFTNKKILVIDDDVRNIFAIASALESKGMKVIHAENGKLGIKVLHENPDVDLILMDTMMPEMDGAEATKEVRKLAEFKDLPIISLTAKAMKGDREKCIEAGASDYITKPVDLQSLLLMMNAWLNNSKQ